LWLSALFLWLSALLQATRLLSSGYIGSQSGLADGYGMVRRDDRLRRNTPLFRRRMARG
jgi:hypothetical protein